MSLRNVGEVHQEVGCRAERRKRMPFNAESNPVDHEKVTAQRIMTLGRVGLETKFSTKQSIPEAVILHVYKRCDEEIWNRGRKSYPMWECSSFWIWLINLRMLLFRLTKFARAVPDWAPFTSLYDASVCMIHWFSWGMDDAR